jgi:hypothetical protein
MKISNIIKTTICLIFPLLSSAQVQLINNGANIRVNTAVDLRVEDGGIKNENGGQITNDGNIYLDRDFDQNTTATYFGGATSWLWFEGAANQNILSDAEVDIARLRADNGNRVILSNNVNISTEVNFLNNTLIELGAQNLVILAGGSITNFDANNFVLTNGTGILQQEVAVSPVIFPVGFSIYNPATLTNSGTTDNFRVRVEDQVLDAYPAGTIEIEGVVSKVWMIDEITPGGSDLTMTLQWETSDELPNFNRAASGISHWIGTNWDRSPTWTNATAVGATTWTQTRSGITTFSPFAIEDFEMDLPVELLNFTAERLSPSEVNLNWQTASELNNSGFFVERMLENENSFTSIAWLDGFGTTSEVTHYNYVDNNAYTGVSYYRLRQVDFDGTESFSEVRAVTGREHNIMSDVDIFPIPVKDDLNIRFGKLPEGVTSAQVRIVDLTGRVLFNSELALQSYQVLKIEAISDWPPAMYLLSLKMNNGDSLIEKFLKQSN